MVALIVLILATTDRQQASSEWLQWGGPNRDFQVSGRGLHWKGSAPRRLWERELGDGFSSVVGDSRRLYVAYRRGDANLVARSAPWTRTPGGRSGAASCGRSWAGRSATSATPTARSRSATS